MATSDVLQTILNDALVSQGQLNAQLVELDGRYSATRADLVRQIETANDQVVALQSAVEQID